MTVRGEQPEPMLEVLRVIRDLQRDVASVVAVVGELSRRLAVLEAAWGPVPSSGSSVER